MASEKADCIKECEEGRAPVRNALDLLLGGDAGVVKMPTEQVEIRRLSGLYEAPFIVTVKALSPERWEELQNMAVSVKGQSVDVDTGLQTHMVIDSVFIDPETTQPLFRSKGLMDKYDAPTPKELVKKILLPGEIVRLADQVSTLSGFGDDSVAEVKN